MRATLEADDVVFMYVPGTDSVLTEYGATVCAWGGAHTGEEVRRLTALGVHATGDVWCLTAGAAALHHHADLRAATVRDMAGQPIAVPWLPDVTHQGTPSLWGCFSHPAYRAHLRAKVAEAMAGGAAGLHIDDHLGSAHPTIEYGGCFCDFCIAAFGEHLRRTDTPSLKAEAGVTSFDGFDYRELVRKLAASRDDYIARQTQMPLHEEFVSYQLLRAAENVRQLGRLAAEIVERPITLSANTALPDLAHVVVAPHLTHLVGEVAHNAAQGTGGLLNAVRAYRMAESLGKPMAATARGADWAWIKEHHAHHLARLWIGLAYACGQRLMAPHKAWCYLPGIGTQWYHGPTGAYAPVYRFVRANPALFRETRTVGPLAAPPGVPTSFETPAARRRLQDLLDYGHPEPLRAGDVWLFPRERADGTAVVHLLNLRYESARDAVVPQQNVTVDLPASLFRRAFTSARWHDVEHGEAPLALELIAGTTRLVVPQLKTWGIVALA